MCFTCHQVARLLDQVSLTKRGVMLQVVSAMVYNTLLLWALRLQQVLVKPRNTETVQWRQRRGGLISLVNIKDRIKYTLPSLPFDTLVTGMGGEGEEGEKQE